MKKALLCAAAVLFIAFPATAKIIDIKAIAGRTPAQVEKVLGKPTGKENVKPRNTGCNPCPKMIYKKGKYEIVYINGIADWITVNELSGLFFGKSVLQEFNLPISKPAAQNDTVIRWDNFGGFQSISFFGYDGKADYIYFKLKTK